MQSGLQLQNNKRKCKHCEIVKDFIMEPRRAGTKLNTYRNSDGRPWHGTQCPECFGKSNTARARKRGIKPRDEVIEPTQVKGRNAERIAEKHFKSLGYKTKITAGMGPDLYITKGSLTKTCEVKSCIEKSERGCFFVQSVAPLRRGDDLIAIVLPNGLVHVEEMMSHLSKCARTGSRAVTNLIRKRAWVGAPECSLKDKLIAAEAVRKATLKHGKYSKNKGVVAQVIESYP